jgi:AcrR family transcriptional regulator
MREQSNERRARILAATLVLVGREGAASLRTRMIACEAGVNLSAVHHCFGSKDALLMAVLDDVTGLLIEVLASPAQVDHGLRAALAKSTATLWALTDGQPRLPVVRCELLLYLLRRPAYVQEARAQQRRYLAALEDLYRQCRARPDEGVACPTLAQLVASQVDGLALHGAFVEPANTHRQLRAQALRVVLGLLEEAVPPTGTAPGSDKGTRRGTVRQYRPATHGDAPGVGSTR